MNRSVILVISSLAIITLAGIFIFKSTTSAEQQRMHAAAELYEQYCNNCHNGQVAEAPLLASLQILSKEALVTTLTTGVMKNQAALLSPEQINDVADYLSAVKPDSPTAAIQGQCDNPKENGSSIDPHPVTNWGFNLQNHRYIPPQQTNINAQNVQQLKLSWVFAFPNATRARSQVSVYDQTLYTSSPTGLIYALDRKTGCIRWTYQAEDEVRSAITIGIAADGSATKLFFGDFKANIYSFDLASKTLDWKVKVDEHPVATITGSLNLFEDRLYVPISSGEVISAMDSTYACCTFRGAVVALDAASGQQIWKQYTIAETPREQGKTKNGVPILAPSGAPVWSSPTIDEKRRLIYVGTGENYTRPTSTTSDAILALSMDTGEIIWSQQALTRDAWNAACAIPGAPNCPPNHGPDFDFGAPPMLISDENGKDWIFAGQKSGMVYALDPDKQGAFSWERRVGRGGIMGGIHWGMASDGERLYVPINDQSVWPADRTKPPKWGLHALQIPDGTPIWSTIEEDRCGEEPVEWACAPGISAAISATDELIFTGAMDGWLKIYEAKTGKEVWSFNTHRDFESVNGVKAYGATVDSDGPVIYQNQFFITSGYAKYGGKAGNVLLAFELAD
ncbi:MAG: PQQ-binding-like beta-propeller repeat protein [Saprospiraceae bacterium]|nr:PQQ-binding-like beta-propeller repeat protein [Saprospiraceae bacterium]